MVNAFSYSLCDDATYAQNKDGKDAGSVQLAAEYAKCYISSSTYLFLNVHQCLNPLFKFYTAT